MQAVGGSLISFQSNCGFFNPIVVSGYAYGTDITDHKAALDCNLQTVGCMAQCLQNTYPANYKKYRPKLEAHGWFVTDFWSTSEFKPSYFIRRNRLITGLSEVTVVIESAGNGGSLITADLAFGYNREVFALPGRVNDPHSIGCINLIKKKPKYYIFRKTSLIFLNWDLKIHSNSDSPKAHKSLDGDEKRINKFLKK